MSTPAPLPATLPRILRFVEHPMIDRAGRLAARLDRTHNVLEIDKAIYENLEEYQKRMVIHTRMNVYVDQE